MDDEEKIFNDCKNKPYFFIYRTLKILQRLRRNNKEKNLATI